MRDIRHVQHRAVLRGDVTSLAPKVAGYVTSVEVEYNQTFRTGDVLFRPELIEVSRRFPNLDAMVVHLGGTRILGVLLTMDGRQGAELVDLLRPPVTVPVHYDDYPVFRSPLSDFLDEVGRRQQPGAIRTARRGETVPLVNIQEGATT